MTNANECPAAELGRRIAAIDPKLDAYDVSARDYSGFSKIAYDNALQHAYDGHQQLTFALSHVKATSPDGAAAQVAAIIYMLARHEDTEHKWEREECSRAIGRLVHSALGVLMDRQEADWVTSGVEALAHQMHNPWVAPDIRISAQQEADELRREDRRARETKAA